MTEIRCGKCSRKLGEGTYVVLAIKCPRCGTLNHLRASTPQPHAIERPTLEMDTNVFFKNQGSLERP
ncbi:Com family DNA-binding transcriptional regulator [Comamonas odontotermitis]|uniref:Com family DNA-binding transcriptional regulator n=1 Tax=Comamonas odontotermitis TaxID=379895 RepID=UPI00366C7E48